ncbi:MAG: Antistasin family protein [Myxococcales bacterium]|nr:Antistasin family protein [Myxococcales bacterium]
MRLVFSLLALAGFLAGCQLGSQADAFGGEPGSGSGSGSGSPNHECTVNSDCVAAGVKCCDCPTFAVPRTDPSHNACNGISCPVSQCSQNVRAECQTGSCVLACAPMVCSASCADGFATDANGCLSCACAAPPMRECVADSDCARVRADCCGCANGGKDTAVPQGQATAHDDALMCPINPSCPSVDTCAPDLAPTCVQGSCQLIAGGLPANACGRSDLPACAAGDVCTVNANAAATVQGLGVCTAP